MMLEGALTVWCPTLCAFLAQSFACLAINFMLAARRAKSFTAALAKEKAAVLICSAQIGLWFAIAAMPMIFGGLAWRIAMTCTPRLGSGLTALQTSHSF
jgi:hypothetical protein